MARKAYSDEERAQVKEALMVTMIRCIADRGLIHSSIDVLYKELLRNRLPYKFVQRKHLSCRYLYSANGWVEVLPE